MTRLVWFGHGRGFLVSTLPCFLWRVWARHRLTVSYTPTDTCERTLKSEFLSNPSDPRKRYRPCSVSRPDRASQPLHPAPRSCAVFFFRLQGLYRARPGPPSARPQPLPGCQGIIIELDGWSGMNNSPASW
ncbi:hypothetical protein BDP55DRAFT_181512 [Colletotrichum godetiae]|uniref:Uncharacterized protein n=1 Tax=Colletotrichum godetiae TaxID=1209918 RepID=A0AAJ0EWK1_9PEZI|nr:uncharacterized protein BDP55DRAFT_181512 [Colletotrichum godetiae]KAK1674305.1 hypothetical protein BDP55DRAFT_181512 [Colletotrichum godetiae]